MKGLDTLSKKEIEVLNIPETMPPCPFCGEEVYVGKHPYMKGAYNLSCGSKGYGCIVFPSTGPLDFNEVDKAIEQWCKSVKE